MEPMTAKEISKALALLAETDICENNHLLASILLIASSHIDDLVHSKREAESLALSIWEEYYKKESPDFELCDSVAGVITQIDNMVTGLIKGA